MMGFKILAVLSVSLWLIGCATTKEWIPYSGSKSDGVVKLAFEYRSIETPEIEPGQANRVATERCLAWGYTGAEPFGGAMRQCIRANQYGCLAYRVTADFQCTGKTD